MNRERRTFVILFPYTEMRYRFQYVFHYGESRISTWFFPLSYTHTSQTADSEMNIQSGLLLQSWNKW